MKLLLADIKSLDLNLRELPPVDESVAREFAGMLRHNLDDSPDGELQVFDFNALFEQGERVDPALQRTPTGDEDSAWRAYLAQTQVQVSIDTDPVAMRPLETASMPPVGASVATAAAPGETLSGLNTGAELPPGGNGLPPLRALLSPDALTESVTAAARPPSIAAAAAPDGPGGVERGETAAVIAAGPGQNRGSAEAAGVRSDALPRPGADPANGAVPVRNELFAGMTQPVSIDEAARHVVPVQSGSPGAAATPALFTRAEITLADPDSVTPPHAAHGANEPLPMPGRESPTPPHDPARATLAAAGQTAGQTVRVTPAVAVDPDHYAPRNPAAVALNQTTATAATAETALPDSLISRAVDAFNPGNANAAQTATPTVSAPNLINPPPLNPGNALPTPVETLSLARPNDPAAWGQGLGERVSWMVNHQQNSATIRLDPPMLGKLDVQIRMADDATTITIQTQHPQTRDLIEASSVRLREFLQDSGFQNVNVDVSHRQEQQQARGSLNPESDAEAADDGDAANDVAAPSAGVVNAFGGVNLVDTFV